MENGRTRIADIAEELGLSTAAVSNVIHGKIKENIGRNGQACAGAFGKAAIYSEYGRDTFGTE